MNNNDMNFDQSIYLSDILIRALRMWKRVLLATVIGAALLSGYTLLTGLNPEPVLVMSAEQIAEAEAKIAENEALITANRDAIQANVDTAAGLENSIDVNKTAISDKKSEIKRIERSNEELEALEEIYQQTVDTTLAVDVVGDTFAADVLSLTVKIADTQHAISENEARIVALTKEIKDLEQANKAVPTDIEALKEASHKLEGDITGVEEQNAALREEMAATVVPEFSVMSVVRNAVIGFIFGVVVMGGYIVMTLCLDHKLHCVQDLEESFGLYLLGTIRPHNQDKSKFLDRLIDKISGVDTKVDSSNQYELAASKIKALSRTNKALVTGTASAENLQSVTDGLMKVLSNEELELSVSGNPLYSPETLSKIVDYELVLVEKIGETNTEELKKLIQFLQLSDVHVLGVIAMI